jgi:hypothetical protein
MQQFIDDRIVERLTDLKIDRLNPVGMVEPMLYVDDRNKKRMQIMKRNSLKPSDVTPVVVDDKYNVTWHHRKISSSIRKKVSVTRYLLSFAVSINIAHDISGIVDYILDRIPEITTLSISYEAAIVLAQAFNGEDEAIGSSYTFFQIEYEIPSSRSNLCCVNGYSY